MTRHVLGSAALTLSLCLSAFVVGGHGRAEDAERAGDLSASDHEEGPRLLPDPRLTPGAVRTTDAREICSHGTAGERHWSRERDDRTMAEYGLPTGPHPDYEIDHLIPLGIGGADDDRNLWPQARRSLAPTWSAERKDELEWVLRPLICAGALGVRQAQEEIERNWIAAYRKYVLAGSE
jgi:hypothetical protein